MKLSITPLRYPGGKTWLLNHIKKFITFNQLRPEAVVEPFAGSAAISLGLLYDNNVQYAYLNESDPLIVAFWETIKQDPDKLIEFVSSVDVNLETWNSFRRYLSDDAVRRYGSADLAKAFLFFNRTNFSGILAAGPLGGKRQQSRYTIDSRFNKELLTRKLKELEKVSNRIYISRGDGILFMKHVSKNTITDNLLFYIDPPYYAAGRQLYRRFFTNEEHIDLSEYLKGLDFPWLLSYDDSEFIRELYMKKESQQIYTDHQAGHFKKGVSEILYSNRIIPPVSPSVSDSEQKESNKISEQGVVSCR